MSYTERDPYDLAHEETGSGNISKATSEWAALLEQARTAPRQEELVLHEAYRLLNEQVEHGIVWSKCMNCGCPYVRANGTAEFCDDETCEVEYREELNTLE